MRNQETLDNLVLHLENNCADLLDAARKCGVSLQFVRQWRKDDETTDQIITAAMQNGVAGLISEATRRAVHGVEKGVYYRGELVATETEYSDTLLTTLLKARVPEFAQREDQRPQLTVNIANLMPRAGNYEEWLAMKDQTAQRSLPTYSDSEAAEAVAPAQDVLDADFTPIECPFKGIEL
jgi:hypothetical protein